MVSQISNKEIKNILKILPQTVPAGSYGRNSNLDFYKDLDLITILPINDIIEIIKQKYKVKIIRKGLKLASIKLDNLFQVDIWSTDIENFWETYMRRYFPKHKIISINKKLKK